MIKGLFLLCVQDSDDEDEQAEVMQQAQLLMDCVADLVTHEGVDGMQVYNPEPKP